MTNPLADIRQYAPRMTISQVLKFCEKKGLTTTRAMVQNYIRAGLMPPPVDKRFYTHKHLAALALIEQLKTVFELPEIRDALVPYMDEEGLPLEAYEELMQSTENFAAEISPEIRGLPGMCCVAALKSFVQPHAGGNTENR